MRSSMLTVASGSSSGHDPGVLLSVVLLCFVGLAVCGGYLIVSTSRRGGRANTAWGKWRDVALVCACGALAFYLWGCLHLLFLDETRQFTACLEAGGPEKAARVDAFVGDFIPLRLQCHIRGGGSYSAGVPGYVNPIVAVLTLGAVATAACATAARAQLKKMSTMEGTEH
ncbi:hypothetical protein [Streptomyces sp. NBC_00503]|uniref:hypothetical protein n=1 Tax=Streptomyces sp. NBC_00503 TaxID=2903659 RepID=UPI002E8067CF|nr:hypothetical protein [Streptomyces sp. NBC_00503]WUD81053.1 hypothetical protein OG490_11125 [Streptomyces sp. NBC_00503]